MFLAFFKILVPFLFNKTVNLCLCTINLKLLENFRKIFTVKILLPLSKLPKSKLDHEFCGQILEIIPEMRGLETLLRSYCVKNSQKTEILKKY